MASSGDFQPSVALDVVRLKHGKIVHAQQAIATEVPFTIIANDTEIVTLLATPLDLKELSCGYLFTSGFIKDADDIVSYRCDTNRWVADVTLKKEVNPELMRKRLYTSGCGRGVMYASVGEISARQPLESDLSISREQIGEMSAWLQQCSALYRETGAVHTAAISTNGAIPQIQCDDIGRHNAVDKVIGAALLKQFDFAKAVLICSGRMSSEILHKAKMSTAAIVISRGAPTHQTILRARDTGVTVIGFARGGGFTIYSHKERIVL